MSEPEEKVMNLLMYSAAVSLVLRLFLKEDDFLSTLTISYFATVTLYSYFLFRDHTGNRFSYF